MMRKFFQQRVPIGIIFIPARDGPRGEMRRGLLQLVFPRTVKIDGGAEIVYSAAFTSRLTWMTAFQGLTTVRYAGIEWVALEKPVAGIGTSLCDKPEAVLVEFEAMATMITPEAAWEIKRHGKLTFADPDGAALIFSPSEVVCLSDSGKEFDDEAGPLATCGRRR